MVYIWKELNVEKDDWMTLNKTIWKYIFKTQDILQGLNEDEMEMRHEISRKVCKEAYD